jgi:hypothetical protein
MTVSGQFSCPPPGSFVAVSGQFLVAADKRETATVSGRRRMKEKVRQRQPASG